MSGHGVIITLVLLAFSIPAYATYDSTILADSPVAFWDLKSQSGTETDLTGNGHTGTYNGASPVKLTTLPDGESVDDFNTGTLNQYISVPNSSVFSIPTTGQLTFEGWIRADVSQFTGDAGSGYVDWMGKCDSYSPTCEWEARMYSTTTSETPNRPNRTSGYVFNNTAGTGSAGDWQPALVGGGSSSIYAAFDWEYVVVEYQTLTNTGATGCTTPIGTIMIWVNGVEWDQAIHSDTGCMSQYGITPTAHTSVVNIGTMATGDNAYFQGAIGKVAIYDSLLTQTQINNHFTAMTGTSPSGSCGDTCTVPFPLSLSTATVAGISFSGIGTITGNGKFQ